MVADVSWPTAALAFAALFGSSISAGAQSAHRDGIAELISKSAREAKTEKVAETTLPVASPPSAANPSLVGPPAPQAAAPAVPKDPREGEEAYEQARQLMLAVDAILQDTAEQRTQAQKLPGRDEFILTPLWTETREDREARIRNLLDSALGIVTDVPIVEMQKKVEGLRQNIREIEANIATLKEKQITAPKDAMLPGPALYPRASSSSFVYRPGQLAGSRRARSCRYQAAASMARSGSSGSSVQSRSAKSRPRLVSSKVPRCMFATPNAASGFSFCQARSRVGSCGL